MKQSADSFMQDSTEPTSITNLRKLKLNNAGQLVHGTAVSVDGKVALFVGASGSGKSSLALQLLALGAQLIADDQCVVRSCGEFLQIERPEGLPELIEARGIGLLNASMADRGSLRLIVDMDRQDRQRMPSSRFIELAGHQVELISGSTERHFPSAILLYLRHEKPK